MVSLSGWKDGGITKTGEKGDFRAIQSEDGIL